MPLSDPRLSALADEVGTALAGVRRLGVAFSGGVDSTLLLALAVRTLGAERVVAITGVSPSLARRELAAARRLASALGVEHVELETAEADLPEYRRNDLDRCFHCKSTLFEGIDHRLLASYGLDAIAYGETADDVVRDDRPGARAADEHSVLRPLATAGLGKTDIRALARALGLPNADKPAAPCLASRIPHHSEVTPQKLRQVEEAEDALHDLGLTELRVRHHGDLASIEVPLDLLGVVATELRERVLTAVRAAGFRSVTLDLAGFSSGQLFQIGMARAGQGEGARR